MGGGWICSIKTECRRDNPFNYPASSLVKSNFKFTTDHKPICLRCWAEERIQLAKRKGTQMKRQSKAEEALSGQIKQITTQLQAEHLNLDRVSTRIETLTKLRTQLADEVDRLKGKREEAAKRQRT